MPIEQYDLRVLIRHYCRKALANFEAVDETNESENAGTEAKSILERKLSFEAYVVNSAIKRCPRYSGLENSVGTVGISPTDYFANWSRTECMSVRVK
ncbi:hypothetical protein KIN20_034623 [Parelaphostrongylus tenuis]|uniref:Uncharacterized protein n=1 Tax=Parelaphostrongylus tenuis TaxID=148309 RepID=A0AAD5WJV5_PARTN|nr:hypothetical protein KIN20_034623 [Parelaphostrongylus tenuis]